MPPTLDSGFKQQRGGRTHAHYCCEEGGSPPCRWTLVTSHQPVPSVLLVPTRWCWSPAAPERPKHGLFCSVQPFPGPASALPPHCVFLLSSFQSFLGLSKGCDLKVAESLQPGPLWGRRHHLPSSWGLGGRVGVQRAAVAPSTRSHWRLPFPMDTRGLCLKSEGGLSFFTLQESVSCLPRTARLNFF